MEDQKIYNLVIKKSNWIAQIIYWLVAACLLFFIFSNRGYDHTIRLVFVSFIITLSYIVTYIVNNYLIPRYLFTGKLLVFIYLIVGVFVTILWLILYSLILIVIYNAYNPNIMVPQKDDIIIMVTGSYLIIVFAAVIHFVKESYRKLIEKNDINKQKQIAEIKLNDAKLKLLQGQIHPHFLFNMLNNLYGLVKESADESRNVIVKLSDLLDYMLYKCDKPEVLLADEIQFIQNYIELERVRHDEQFNVKTNFSEIPENAQIAPLILFPFVENAFKHGFHNPTESFIRIDLHIKDQQLIFNIENSTSKLSNDKYLKQEGQGIGLNNSKERLELIYKDSYQLDIVEDAGCFSIKLVIELK
ncbi:MAG: histidine kinase [Bacteroidales bacterium]|jgi:sensor histidine kinase YesM|nr:histidine kinase [Bacteroidales bacterium]